jgi:hypothetical protein
MYKSSSYYKTADLSLIIKLVFFIDILAFLFAEHTLFSNSLSVFSVPLKGLSLAVLLCAILFKKKVKTWLVFYVLISVNLMLVSLVYYGDLFIVSYVVFFIKYLLLALFFKSEIANGVVFLTRNVIILSLISFVVFGDSYTTRGGVDFGFSNENKLPFMLATTFLISFMLSDKSIRIEKIILFFFLIYAAFETGNRTSVVSLVMFGVIFFTISLFPILKKMRFFAPIFIVSLTFFVSTNMHNSLLLNTVLASRPLNWNNFVQEEELKLFPNRLKISQYKEGLSDVEFRKRVGQGDNEAYFFDNAYINIIYRCGLILSVVILCLVLLSFYLNNNILYTAVGISLLGQMFTESAIFLPLGGIVIWLVYGLAKK